MYRPFRKATFKTPQILRACLVLTILTAFICVAGTLYAQNLKPEGWRRMRTNSVPYQPHNVTVDNAGGVWVTAIDTSENDPGVWYRPPEASSGPAFQYFTNDARNNLLLSSYNPAVVMPQLNASVLYAARDKAGNTWYALKNRTVIVEKPDHTWVAFDMPDSSPYDYQVSDTTNVDSAHRIRFIDKPDGSQETLLIAYRGIHHINSGLSIVETRQVYTLYNNDYIQDALIDSHGRYWITSERGLEKGTSLVNTIFTSVEFEADPNAPAKPVTRIMEDSEGNIWFAGDLYVSDGIYCYTAVGQWIKYDDGLVATFGKRAHSIAAGSDGSVWFGSVYSGAGAILRYVPENGGEWTHFTQADLGLQSGQVLSMEFDNGGLWFTTAYTPTVVGNGTGVHYLRFNGEQPAATHYTYRDSSTTLTTLNYKFIAADRSGNVWFPGDDPRVARLNTDGTWTQFHNAGGKPFGNFGFAGVAADSKNRVYFAPQNARPVAYDVNIEQWIDLPSMSYTDYFYYGAYADPEDGKWFYGAFGIYYLDPENSAWTWYDSSNTELFPDYRVDGVLMDDGGNAWFMTWYGIALMKKDPDGGESTWFKFSRGDDSGYTGGYRVYQDDAGQIWNANKQKFNAEDNTWADAADTSAFDQRNLRFLNGRVSAGMDLSDALEPKPVLDERNMTIDSRGTIYFSGGSGIMAFGPPKGDLDGSGIVDLTDAVLAGKVLVDEAAGIYANGDVSGDFKIGLAEIIFILQRVSGLR